MIKKLLVIFLSSLCTYLCFCNPTSAQKASTVSRLKINNGDVSGWTVKTSSEYTQDSWRSAVIDGGVDKYSKDRGFTISAVLDEVLDGGSGKTIEIYALDYGSAANATTMFDYEKTTEYSSYLELLTPDYTDTVAVGEITHSPDIYVFAHFKQFYIELRTSTFSDFPTAKNIAINLLGIFETKINGI